MKVVHLADEHWSSEPEKLEKAKASAEFINQWVNDNQPDLVVIAGDLQDKRQWLTGNSGVLPMVEHVRRLSEVCPVLIIYGNEEHDPKGSLNVLSYVGAKHEIAVSDRAESYGLDDRGLSCLMHIDEVKDSIYPHRPYKLIIHTLPYPTKEWLAMDMEGGTIEELNARAQEAVRGIMMGFAALKTELPKKVPSILIAHCNVIGAELSNGQMLISQDLMIDVDDLRKADVDYIALGHIHKSQEYLKGEPSAPIARYTGSMYHLNFGEPEDKSFTVLDFEEGKLVGLDAIKLPTRRMVLRKAHWTETGITIEDGEDFVDAETRVRVFCRREASENVDLEEIKKAFVGAYSLKIEKIIEPDERTRKTDIQEKKTLRDKLAAWEKTRGNEVEQVVLEKADETEKEAI